MQADELKFDKMVEDTTLAKEYLKQNPEINNLPLYIANSNLQEWKSDLSTKESLNKLKILAKLIKENNKLFCQLECLNRNIPSKEVEEYDLKLLVNNLLYCSSSDVKYQVKAPILFMDNDTPLVNLGWLAQMSLGYSNITMMAFEKTAAICYLFKQLWNKAGLPDITLTKFNDKSDIKRDACLPKELNTFKDFQNGCLGIITNRSDIDSAVDTFLETPTRIPWAVCNILVEESAVDKFKNAINWKTRNQEKVDPDIAKQCSAAYSYEGKLFLYEYVGEKLTNKFVVLINAYRTIKDLLSVAEKSVSVSLWASDVAESNEIAHNLKSNIVWINDFGNFNGPTQTSQAYFSLLQEYDARCSVKVSDEVRKVLKVQSEWLKLGVFERAERMKEICNGSVNFDNFVHVDKKFMCVGQAMPVGLIYVENVSESDLLQMLAIGNGLLMNSVSDKAFNDVIAAGAPLEIVQEVNSGDVIAFDRPVYKMKVIWTSYGTIFAN